MDLFPERLYILDDQQVVPVADVFTWNLWFVTADRRVAQTTLAPDLEVSTVFLGLNHAWGPGPPLLFETMVFQDGDDVWCERYSTWAEAAQGHASIVADLQERLEGGSLD